MLITNLLNNMVKKGLPQYNNIFSYVNDISSPSILMKTRKVKGLVMWTCSCMLVGEVQNQLWVYMVVCICYR